MRLKHLDGLASVILVSLLTLPSPASSETAAKEENNARPDSADCMTVADYMKHSVSKDGFAINNFSAREANDIQSAMTKLEASYSIANRSPQPIRLSADIVFMDDKDTILAALNADPIESQVPSSVTSTGQGYTFVSKGTLVHVKKICLRIFGTFPG